jgi:hypothetical protein
MQILLSNEAMMNHPSIINCLISFSRLMLNRHVMLSSCRDEYDPWLKLKDSGHLFKDVRSWKHPFKNLEIRHCDELAATCEVTCRQSAWPYVLQNNHTFYRMTIRFTEWPYVLQNNHTFYRITIRFTEWPYVLQNDHMFYIITIHFTEWPYVLQNNHTFYRMTIPFTEWLYALETDHIFYRMTVCFTKLSVFQSSYCCYYGSLVELAKG